MIVDLQLPVQSVPITNNVVSSNTAHDEVYPIQISTMTFVSNLQQVIDILRVLRLPPLLIRYIWNIVESGIKHHTPNDIIKVLTHRPRIKILNFNIWFT